MFNEHTLGRHRMHTVFSKKWANPDLFFIYFRPFKHTLQFLLQINVKKCPSSIQCRVSNSGPLEHASPPMTTRPGLPPKPSTWVQPNQ